MRACEMIPWLIASNLVFFFLLIIAMQQNKSLKRRMRYLVMGLKIEPRHELEPPPRPPDYPRRSQRADVILAMIGLGYSKADSKRAVQVAVNHHVDDSDFEALLRKALQMRGAA